MEAAELAASKIQTGIGCYSLACVFALLGNADRALYFLDRAVDAGFVALQLKNNPDLINLHGDPRFESIFSRMKELGQQE